MVRSGTRWTGVGAGLLVAVALSAGAALPGAARAADKPDQKNGDGPLREELLKLNAIATEDGQRAKLLALIKDKDRAKRLVAEADKMLKEAKGKENPFNYNGTLILARLAHFTKQYDAAEALYEHLIETATNLKSGGKMVAAYENLIGMYFDQKKYAQVVEACERFVGESGPEEYETAKAFIYERLAQAKAKEGKFDEALRVADLLVSADAGGWYFVQTKGWVLREQGKLGAAIDAYVESLEKLEANKALKAELKDRFTDRTRYILSGLYVDNKDIPKAAKELQSLIKRHPDNPVYKNDLGYIWGDNDLNLEESEQLIRDALDLDLKEKEKLKKEGKLDEVKPRPAYLDSLGWVLFKQKKYTEALEQLKKAIADEDSGSHMEIWDHLADCYLALGQKKEAIAAWEKGLKFEDLSKRDAERRRKVSDKLKKARADKD